MTGSMQWAIELILIALLAATLFHALRLERALGVLKRDRAALQELVAGFNASTRQAEQGIERLRAAADGAGRQIARQVETATTLRDDLTYLVQRGEQLADRLDGLVRTARGAMPEFARVPELARAPDFARPPDFTRTEAAEPRVRAEEAGEPRVRSQAERDLLKALRMGR
jgi:hypothetical protein